MGAVRDQLVSEIEAEVAAGRLHDWWTQTDELMEEYDNHRPLQEGWEGARVRVHGDDENTDDDSFDEDESDEGEDGGGDDGRDGGAAACPASGAAGGPAPGVAAGPMPVVAGGAALGVAACPSLVHATCPAPDPSTAAPPPPLEDVALTPAVAHPANGPPPLPPPEEDAEDNTTPVAYPASDATTSKAYGTVSPRVPRASTAAPPPWPPAEASAEDEAAKKMRDRYGEGILTCYRRCIEMAKQAGERTLLADLQERLRQAEKKNQTFEHQRAEVQYLCALRIERANELRAHVARERAEDAKLRAAQHKEKMELQEAMRLRDQERVKAAKAAVDAAKTKMSLQASKEKATFLLS